MAEIDPIASFIARYRREYDFYYELARLISQECDALASENGIKAIVTYRAKSPAVWRAKFFREIPINITKQKTRLDST